MNYSILEKCLIPIEDGIVDFEHWLINNDSHIPFGDIPLSFIDKAKKERLKEIGEILFNSNSNYIFFDKDNKIKGTYLDDNNVLHINSIFFSKEKWRQFRIDCIINEC